MSESLAYSFPSQKAAQEIERLLQPFTLAERELVIAIARGNLELRALGKLTGMQAEAAGRAEYERVTIDAVGQREQFLAACCEAGEGLAVTLTDLFAAYESWADTNGFFPMTRAQFATAMSDKPRGTRHSANHVQSPRYRVYEGIGLKPEVTPQC